MQLKCIKCGHINPSASGAAGESCPSCGVIYAKAQATPARTRPGSSSADGASADYVRRLRENTHYPAFRVVSKFFFYVSILVAVVLIVGGVIAMVNKVSPIPAIVGTLAAIVSLLVGKAFTEAAIMGADLVDAALATAAKDEK